MKKKQSKKKKKKEKKAKDEVLGSSSGADENTTSQSSVPISMDDSFVNLSEGETSDVSYFVSLVMYVCPYGTRSKKVNVLCCIATPVFASVCNPYVSTK